MEDPTGWNAGNFGYRGGCSSASTLTQSQVVRRQDGQDGSTWRASRLELCLVACRRELSQVSYGQPSRTQTGERFMQRRCRYVRILPKPWSARYLQASPSRGRSSCSFRVALGEPKFPRRTQPPCCDKSRRSLAACLMAAVQWAARRPLPGGLPLRLGAKSPRAAIARLKRSRSARSRARMASVGMAESVAQQVKAKTWWWCFSVKMAA
jgi:hypothetical protein